MLNEAYGVAISNGGNMILLFQKRPMKYHHRILHSHLGNLPEKSRLAIYYRFWQHKTIEEVARAMRIDWNRADQLINAGVSQLRASLDKDPGFCAARMVENLFYGVL